MSQILNQFNQTPEKGELGNAPNLNVFTGRIYAESVSLATILPGAAVKLVDVAGPESVFDKAAATDAIFGFVKLQTKKNTYVARDLIEVAFDNSVMIMEAGAAILQGASVEIVAATNKVITAAGTNKIVGIALRKAAGDTDLIPVLIKTPLINQVIAFAALPPISFLQLSDTPNAYTAAGLQNVRVNTGATALEFHATSFLDLSDTPDTYAGSASFTVQVNGGATALVFVNVV